MNLRLQLITAVIVSLLSVLLPRIAHAHTSAHQAIEALNQKEADSCRTIDNSITKTLWADDGVDLIQGLQPMVGKKAISDWLDSLTPQLKGAKMEYCTIDWHDLKISGDWAYEWGMTRQKIDLPAPQKPFESAGKMLLILKRQPDNSWEVEIESWNSLPMQR
ncbi:MAG: YybH family protein [Candidatus Acidiferrales bacterium]